MFNNEEYENLCNKIDKMKEELHELEEIKSKLRNKKKVDELFKTLNTRKKEYEGKTFKIKKDKMLIDLPSVPSELIYLQKPYYPSNYMDMYGIEAFKIIEIDASDMDFAKCLVCIVSEDGNRGIVIARLGLWKLTDDIKGMSMINSFDLIDASDFVFICDKYKALI